MKKKLVMATGLALSLSAGQLMAQDAPTCADLNWTAEVLAANPDIAMTCQAVYEKNGKLYAKGSVEVVRVRGNKITFRTLHTDGTKGDSRSVTVPSSWRAEIGGRQYRASDLSRGQQLNVYLPEDRFALAVADMDGPDDADIMMIEEEMVAMPMTASPLFLFGLAGGALLTLGGAVRSFRRRMS